MSSDETREERPRSREGGGREMRPGADGDPDMGASRAARARRRQRWRLVAVGGLLVGLWVVGRWLGLDAHLSREAVRDAVQQAGPWGFAAFTALFAVGELLHVPGLVFVGAAVFAFGKIPGTAAALCGALASVTVSFIVVRAVGGQPLSGLDRWMEQRRGGRFGRTWLYRFVQRSFAQLESRPIRSVALLRLVFWMAPLLNYALAMSSVRMRHYLIGSAIGLAVPVTVASLLFEWLLR